MESFHVEVNVLDHCLLPLFSMWFVVSMWPCGGLVICPGSSLLEKAGKDSSNPPKNINGREKSAGKNKSGFYSHQLLIRHFYR